MKIGPKITTREIARYPADLRRDRWMIVGRQSFQFMLWEYTIPYDLIQGLSRVQGKDEAAREYVMYGRISSSNSAQFRSKLPFMRGR